MKVEIEVKADDIVTWLNNERWMRKHIEEHKNDSCSAEYAEKMRENIDIANVYGSRLFKKIKYIITE